MVMASRTPDSMGSGKNVPAGAEDQINSPKLPSLTLKVPKE